MNGVESLSERVAKARRRDKVGNALEDRWQGIRELMIMEGISNWQ